MLLLRANTDDLEIVTGSAADIEVHLSAMQADASTPPVVQPAPNLGPLASITTAATTQILDTSAITSGHIVNVKHLSVFNNHASQSCVCTVQVNDGTNVTVVAGMKATLLAGESLVLTQGGVALHYDVNGAVYPSVGNAASQAEMEAGTATDKYVTPQGVNWHPGVAKCWGKAVGAGTSLTVNWNITSVADTGTGRLGVTIGTDFSSANYAIIATLERTVTALTATGVEDHAIRNASPTAGVFEIESYDHTAILFAAQDPANYYWACHGDQA
jgi:hypothetical protein